MIALFTALFLSTSAHAAPAFTVDQVIARFSIDMATQCDFEAEDIADRLKNATVYEVASVGDVKTTYQIFELACSHGAYNFNSVYYVGGEYSGLELVQFVEPTVNDSSYAITGYSTVNMLTNSGFEPKTGTMGFFAKGRGLGDCYTSGSYKFQNGRFVLKQYEVDNKCDGHIRGHKIINLK